MVLFKLIFVFLVSDRIFDHLFDVLCGFYIRIWLILVICILHTHAKAIWIFVDKFYFRLTCFLTKTLPAQRIQNLVEKSPGLILNR